MSSFTRRSKQARSAMPRKTRWLLVLCGAAMGAAGADGSDSVLMAVKDGDDARLRALLAERADPNAAEADGTSALHWAVHRAELATAVQLLAAGADADTPNRYGVRPLYLAAENGDAAMVRALLEAGADPNGAFAEGETALMTAPVAVGS